MTRRIHTELFKARRSLMVRFYLPVLIVILFSSCAVTQKLPIQVAIPPKHPVSPKIQSLAILNRSVTPAFTNLQRDSLEKILLNDDLKIDTIMLDSIAADTTIQIAAKTLFQSDRFDVVVPKERFIPRKDKGGLPAPLDSGFINRICKDYNVNAVLVLENFKERVVTDIKAEQYNMGFESFRTYNEYSGVINVTYDLVWRLYQPTQMPPIVKFRTNDTVFWSSFDYSLKNMYQKLPSLKEALIGGGIAAGVDMAENISPKWVNEVRRYYKTGKKEIDAAIPLIKENKWEDAAAIWKRYSSVSSKSLRGKIEFNLALASEMSGNIDQAIEWAEKSYNTHYTQQVQNYLKYLGQRRLVLRKAAQNQLSK
jgi:hypothetical protein